MKRFQFILISFLLIAVAARAQAPVTTTISDVVYRADGGRSRLSRVAHNYFGIKAHGGLPWIELPTHEFEGGRLVRVPARFARYESMEACFADRDRLIARLTVYKEAREHAGDPEAFIRALAGHWATDPKYAEKLLAIYRTHGLDALDRNAGA